MKQVTIYGTPTCHGCKRAKEFFKNRDVDFRYVDASTDAGMREFSQYRQSAVPVIIIGENMVVGFDERKIRRYLR